MEVAAVEELQEAVEVAVATELLHVFLCLVQFYLLQLVLVDLVDQLPMLVLMDQIL